MDPWMIGVDKALATVSQGVESSNGSMIQIGLDRLQTRSEMSQDLAASFPNAFAEAVQEGAAKLWRKSLDLSLRSEKPIQMAALVEDLPWQLGIISGQDEWSKLCIEESVRMMAYSAARCHPLVSALDNLELLDCIHPASSCFTSLFTLDRLARIGEVEFEAQKAVGVMLMAYGMDERSPGLWDKCKMLKVLFQYADLRPGFRSG